MAETLLDKINQQQELSFAPPQNFYMVVDKLPEVSFMTQRVQIPVISGDETVQPNGSNPGHLMMPSIGIDYSVLSVDFVIDKYFKNYSSIMSWFKGIYAAGSTSTWADNFSIITVLGTDAANIPVVHWQFTDCYPISVDGPMFDSTMPDIEYLTSNVTFRFAYFTTSTYTNGADNQENI